MVNGHIKKDEKHDFINHTTATTNLSRVHRVRVGGSFFLQNKYFLYLIGRFYFQIGRSGDFNYYIGRSPAKSGYLEALELRIRDRLTCAGHCQDLPTTCHCRSARLAAGRAGRTGPSPHTAVGSHRPAHKPPAAGKHEKSKMICNAISAKTISQKVQQF